MYEKDRVARKILLLAKEGCDPNATNSKGLTPFQVLSEDQLFQILLAFPVMNVVVNHLPPMANLIANHMPPMANFLVNPPPPIANLLVQQVPPMAKLPVNHIPLMVCLLGIGAKLQPLADGFDKKFEQYIVQEDEHTESGDVQRLVQCGYKFKYLDQIAAEDAQYVDAVARIRALTDQPLSLLHLAASAVRAQLHPNAVVGVQTLVESGELVANLAEAVTLGVFKA